MTLSCQLLIYIRTWQIRHFLIIITHVFSESLWGYLLILCWFKIFLVKISVSLFENEALIVWQNELIFCSQHTCSQLNIKSIVDSSSYIFFVLLKPVLSLHFISSNNICLAGTIDLSFLALWRTYLGRSLRENSRAPKHIDIVYTRWV